MRKCICGCGRILTCPWNNSTQTITGHHWRIKKLEEDRGIL